MTAAVPCRICHHVIVAPEAPDPICDVCDELRRYPLEDQWLMRIYMRRLILPAPAAAADTGGGA